jgi:hypothetical protein
VDELGETPPDHVARGPGEAVGRLMRWEEHGAIWRVRWLGEDEAVVDLLSCVGEPVDELRSRDPELLRYLARRRRSDEE